jgi:hypothetical protein
MIRHIVVTLTALSLCWPSAASRARNCRNGVRTHIPAEV